MSAVKILLAEDHMIVRSGVRMILESEFGKISLTEVDNSIDLFTAIKSDDFNLLILDLILRDGNNFRLVETIKTIKPELKILCFTMLPEFVYGKRLLTMGASGFINKRRTDLEFLNAIRKILNNQTYVSQALSDDIVKGALSQKSVNPFEELSNREFQTMLMMLEGKTTKDIAGDLSVQGTTVATYRSRLFEKLNVTSVIELHNLASVFSII
ncbi:MAG: response regulator transcription factor [Flavitalea sp.]